MLQIIKGRDKEIPSNLTLQSGISNRRSRTKGSKINGNVYKKGQESIGMSFNMLFSIFIIIVIIAVAVYVLVVFLDDDGPIQCANTGLFYDDLQEEIKNAWSGDDVAKTYKYEIKNSGALKTGLSHVCFGNLSYDVSTGSEEENMQREFIRLFRYKEHNVFMYPPEKACKGLEAKKIDYVVINGFFCVNIENNKGIIRLKLESKSGSPVKLSEG